MSDQEMDGYDPDEQVNQTDCIWQVEICAGLPMSTDPVTAPIKMDETMSIYLGGPGGISEPVHRVCYGPVSLHGNQAALRLQVPSRITRAERDRALDEQGYCNVGMETVRIMLHPVIEFDGFGADIFAEGFEEHPDGHVVLARWRIEPYVEEG